MPNIEIAAMTGRKVVLNAEAIEQFRNGLRGGHLIRGDDGYEPARKIYNAMIEHQPAIIARCAGVADVIAAVNFARNNGLLLSVRGGGHNVSGNAVSDGGLMIDLSPMKACGLIRKARPTAPRLALPGASLIGKRKPSG